MGNGALLSTWSKKSSNLLRNRGGQRNQGQNVLHFLRFQIELIFKRSQSASMFLVLFFMFFMSFFHVISQFCPFSESFVLFLSLLCFILLLRALPQKNLEFKSHIVGVGTMSPIYIRLSQYLSYSLRRNSHPKNFL